MSTKKYLLLFVFLLIIITIGGIIFYFTNINLNSDEKYVLSVIQRFKRQNLKYPESLVIEDIIYSKNDNLNERVVQLKLKAVNRDDKEIEDYVYIYKIGNKSSIETNLCYELLKENPYENINNYSTPYSGLSNTASIMDEEITDSVFGTFGAHYMGYATKEDFMNKKYENKTDINIVNINIKKIKKHL